MSIRTTHTYAKLEVSQRTYSEIKGLLSAAGYSECFVDDMIVLHGIGLAAAKIEVTDPTASNGACPKCHAQDDNLAYDALKDQIHCKVCNHVDSLGEFRMHLRELKSEEPITR